MGEAGGVGGYFQINPTKELQYSTYSCLRNLVALRLLELVRVRWFFLGESLACVLVSPTTIPAKSLEASSRELVSHALFLAFTSFWRPLSQRRACVGVLSQGVLGITASIIPYGLCLNFSRWRRRCFRP